MRGGALRSAASAKWTNENLNYAKKWLLLGLVPHEDYGSDIILKHSRKVNSNFS